MWVINKYQCNVDIEHKCNKFHLHANIGGLKKWAKYCQKFSNCRIIKFGSITLFEVEVLQEKMRLALMKCGMLLE